MRKRIDGWKFTFEIEIASDEWTVATHEGHICGDCSDIDHDHINRVVREVVFHFTDKDGCQLRLVDIRGTQRTRGRVKPVMKYVPEEAPEFLAALGHAVARQLLFKGEPADAPPRADEFEERFVKAEDVRAERGKKVAPNGTVETFEEGT